MLDERNINEGNPKTNWIDRAHVIRRGKDATRQLPSGFLKPRDTCRTFQAAILISGICRKIRYQSPILSLGRTYTRPGIRPRHYRGRRGFFLRRSSHSGPSIFHGARIRQAAAGREIYGGREFLRSMRVACYARGSTG